MKPKPIVARTFRTPLWVGEGIVEVRVREQGGSEAVEIGKRK